MSATGPTTAAGKATASRNATRHGLLAAIPVVPGLERPEDWDTHLAGVIDSLAPEGHLEKVLAERVALQLWRLHRIVRYEAHLSRELYKAMHELEALQARRRGQHTPLARLDIDVSGLPENPKLRNELPG